MIFLKVYDVLRARFREANYFFEDICDALIQHDNSPKRKNKKSGNRSWLVEDAAPQPPGPNCNPVQVFWLNLLGPSLRSSYTGWQN